MQALRRQEEMDPREIHDILRNERRRKVLKQLQRRVEPVSLRELSEKIAALETGESPPPRNVRQSVYNSLHQTHLPKLDEKRVIDYDDDRKTVALRNPARQVDLYMEVVTRYGITWAGYYRTLGVLALFAVVAVNADALVFGGIPTLAVAVVFLVVFGVSTAYQLWSRRWFYLRSLLSGS
jgi:hypothetical protein